MSRPGPRPALVARPGSRLLVDGTNVAWAWPPVRALLVARAFGAAQRLLVDRIAMSGVVPAPGGCTVVFDGPPPAGGPATRGAVAVRYPEPGESGDDRLLQLIAATAHADVAVHLVTNDRALRDRARGHGATTAGAGALLDRLDPGWRPEHRAGPRTAELRDPKPRPTARDTAQWLRRFGVAAEAPPTSPRRPRRPDAS